MCTGAEIGLILAATGAGTNMMNQRAALKEQDRQTARGLRTQSDIQRQSSRRAMEQVEDIAGSRGVNEQRELGAAYLDALRRSQGGVDEAMPAVGAANPRYAEHVAAQQGALGQEMQGRAGRMSVLDGAAMQRQREGQRMGRTASDLAQFNDQSKAQDYLTRLRVAAAQPNPWVSGISQLMQGVGTAMALAPAGAATTTAGAPVTAAAASPAGMTADTLAKFRTLPANPYLGNPASIPGFWP